MNIVFDHFLLYSINPEKTFEDAYNLAKRIVGNTKLEILHYPKEIPAPNSNGSELRFVGIALKTNIPPEETLKVLREKV